MRPSDRSLILTPLIVTVFSFALFAWNAAPGVTFHDSGEFALAARTGGIPHPPGAPTWTLPATLWVNVLGFGDNPALGTNLFAGFNGALCFGAITLLVMLWVRRLRPDAPNWQHVSAGVTPALVLLHSSGWLEQSLMTEQYTQMTLLEVLLMILATRLWSVAPGRQRDWLAWGIGLTAGLAIGNHLSQVALGLPVFLALCFATLQGDQSVRDKVAALLKLNLLAGLGTFCGLLVFLYLPIRSAADPVMDWGNPETLDGFRAALSREQWGRRPISEAPLGYVREWIGTYNPVGELGVAGLLLAAVGFGVMVRRAKRPLAMLLSIPIPYALGMMIGHMGQQGLDIQYIRLYGVIDWHIPLYASAAISAGVGLFILFGTLMEKPARVACGVAMLLLAAGGVHEVRRQSLRDWKVPELLLETILSGVPGNSVLLLSSDNLSHGVAYRQYAVSEPHPCFMAYNLLPLGPDEDQQTAWNKKALVDYLTEDVLAPANQPLRLVPPDRQDLMQMPFYSEFNPRTSLGEERYLLPKGFLVEVMERETTNEEVRSAEADFNAQHPGYYPVYDPNRPIHRLEREAWCYLYLKRGGFFRMRGMVDEAITAYRESLKWAPNHPDTLVTLGYLHEERGELPEAAAAYEAAIDNYRYVADARVNLAILHARAGRLDAAIALLEQELEIRPGNELAAANLETVRRNREAAHNQQ